MREIKFRAYHIASKNMDYSSLNSISFDGKRIYYGNDDFTGYFSNCPIMQFTGLLDKNGKEIYEGDIVKQSEIYDCMGQLQRNEITIAQLQLHCWCVGLNKEIIGNIYENPELLK